MRIEYYELLIKGISKEGMFFPTEDEENSLPMLLDEDALPDLENVFFTLRLGCYADYMKSVISGRFVSEELMNLFKTYLKPEQKVVFVPVKVTSEEYGDRIYYLMHFEEIYDVIDPEHTVYDDIPEEDLKQIVRIGDPYNKNADIVSIPALDYKGIKGLDIFNWFKYSDNIIVSERVMKEMKKRKLDGGIEFWSVWCYNAE